MGAWKANGFTFPSLTLMGSPYGGRNWLVLARTTCADMCEYIKLDFRAIACYDGRMSELVEAIRAIGVLHLGGAVIDCARLADTMDKNGWTGTPEELAEVNRRLELSHLALVELTKDAPHD